MSKSHLKLKVRKYGLGGEGQIRRERERGTEREEGREGERERER